VGGKPAQERIDQGSHWQGITLSRQPTTSDRPPFFEDGMIQLDNNAIEKKIRLLAQGRKNFLFAT